MPSISLNLLISLSNISKVFSLNLSIIFLAVIGPIPYITPEARYFSIPSSVFGIISSHSSILICLPKLGCNTHSPFIFKCMPSFIKGTTPTAVNDFSPLESFATIYPFSSL
ncbi:hypothetical protein D3C76_1404680 [compost metagenome]